MPQIIAIWNSSIARIRGVGGSPIDTTNDLLQEDGFFLLLETGDKILLEQQ